jgi:AbrB family looped-hinge helix DNA binding protein
MSKATVTSKGQITIPKAVREALGLEPGDRIAFHICDDGTVVFVPETVDLRDLFGVLKPKVRGITVEDMKRAVRERGAKL